MRSGARYSPQRRSETDRIEAAEARRLFWRVADHLDYLLTVARLRTLDALAGPLPETPADQQRARDRERMKRAFPEIEP
jgi:hypothetical protein